MKIAAPIICVILGLIIGCLNYRISRHFLKKNTISVFTLRSIICVLFLTADFFVSRRLPGVNTPSMLIGGVIGISITSIIFTKKLLNQSNGDDKLG